MYFFGSFRNCAKKSRGKNVEARWQAGGANVTAVTKKADPFCTGNEQRSFLLLGFCLVATERTTTFLSGAERTGMP